MFFVAVFIPCRRRHAMKEKEKEVTFGLYLMRRELRRENEMSFYVMRETR